MRFLPIRCHLLSNCDPCLPRKRNKIFARRCTCLLSHALPAAKCIYCSAIACSAICSAMGQSWKENCNQSLLPAISKPISECDLRSPKVDVDLCSGFRSHAYLAVKCISCSAMHFFQSHAFLAVKRDAFPVLEATHFQL